MSRCRICKKEFAVDASSKAVAPFCSARCKQIDLNKWLSEDYRVPTNQKTSDEEETEGTGERYEA